LAKGLYRTEEYEDALGVLARAHTLLDPYPQWQDEVIRLRFTIENVLEDGAFEKPKEKKGYY